MLSGLCCNNTQDSKGCLDDAAPSISAAVGTGNLLPAEGCREGEMSGGHL